MNSIDIDAIICENLKREQKERTPRTLYCSEIGYCKRKVYFDYFNPKEVPSEIMKKFFLGDVIHEKVTEMLRNHYYVSSEQPVVIYLPSVDFRLSGRYDDLVTTEEGKMLIEKKSVSDISFISKPLYHHLMQTNLYMKALGVEDAQIVYIDKPNLAVKSFHVKFSNEIFREALDRVYDIVRHIMKRRIPKAEAKLNQEMSWQCKFCPFQDECMKAGLGEKNENA